MDTSALIPEMTFGALIILYFSIGLFIKGRYLLTAMALGSCMITVSFLITAPYGQVFGGAFVADPLSQSFKFVFHVGLALSLLISLRYGIIKDGQFFEYVLLMMLATLAMMLVASSRDLIPLFLSIELMALCSYLLTGLARDDLRSNEAGLKYYLLGTLASITLLIGISALYLVTGTTDIKAIGEFLRAQSGAPNPYEYLGIIAVLIALSFKAGAVPFHQWSPDVYEGAPTTVTAFMSVGPKAASLSALGAVLYGAFGGDPEVWVNTLIFIAVATMAIGNILALRQDNLKRLLAYSSIAHVGYMMLGLLAPSQEGLSAIVLYMLIYAFMNIGAFAVVLSIQEGEGINAYRGLASTNPFMALCMLILLFSLAGIPPFAGFIAKFRVFMAAIHAGYTVVALLGILFSVLSAYYYLRIVVKMYFDTTELPHSLVPINLNIATATAVLAVCLLGIAPSLLI
jgi:NADH-quinone oxidoreductase subunit N